jgi:hypothetical protein
MHLHTQELKEAMQQEPDPLYKQAVDENGGRQLGGGGSGGMAAGEKIRV